MVELQDERFAIVGSALEVGVGLGEDVEGVDMETLGTEDLIAEKIVGSGTGEVSVDDSHWKRIELEELCSDFGGTCIEREH